MYASKYRVSDCHAQCLNASVPGCSCPVAFDAHLTIHCCRLLDAVAVCWCILDLVLHGDVCCHGCRIYLLHDLVFEDMM